MSYKYHGEVANENLFAQKMSKPSFHSCRILPNAADLRLWRQVAPINLLYLWLCHGGSMTPHPSTFSIGNGCTGNIL